MVSTVTVPGDVAKAQAEVRNAAQHLNLTEEEPRKRKEHFLFFTNKNKKFDMKMGKSRLGIGINNSADNCIGAFFYPVEEYDVTTVVLTEEKNNVFAKSLRDQMVVIVKQKAPI
jgi:hypothetical protein